MLRKILKTEENLRALEWYNRRTRADYTNGSSTLCYLTRSWDAKLGKRKRRTTTTMNAPFELPTGAHKDCQNGLFIADKRLGEYYEESDDC